MKNIEHSFLSSVTTSSLALVFLLQLLFVGTALPKANAQPEELNRVWGKSIPADLSLFNFERCRGKTGDSDDFRRFHSLPSRDGKAVFPECFPDTVYSWGTPEKLAALKEKSGNTPWALSYRAVYSTRSPLFTHGYGHIPIRIKFRGSVRWIPNQDGSEADAATLCEQLPLEEKMNAVFFRVDNLLDIVICSPLTIESWSYGLKEHYDEIIREYRYIKSTNTADLQYDGYDSYDANPFDDAFDGHDFSENYFWQSMRYFAKTIRQNAGEFFCNPLLPRSACNEEQHFKTRTPIYYNPD